MSQTDLSIIICTRDHADSLRHTLSSIGRAAVPDGVTGEVLVVDNAPPDGSTAAVAAASATLSNGIPVRHVPEPRPGKGYAYNTGVARATGQVLLFTDDDVRVPPQWLAGMAGPLLCGTCDAVAGGVRLAPALQRPWMTEFHRGCLADTGRLDAVDAPPELVGANMAMARAVFDRVAGFDEQLGPGRLGFADESLLSLQLLEAGLRVCKRLDVVVEHHCDPGRLARREWVTIARRMGQSWGYVSHHWEHQPPRATLRWAVKRSLRLAAWRLTRRRECRGPEGMPEWEVRLRIDVAQLRWRWSNRHAPYRYARHGLAPLDLRDGTQSATVGVGPLGPGRGTPP